MKTFALATPENPRTVALWCEDHGVREDGLRPFTCINGAWDGVFRISDETVKIGAARLPGKLIWEGEVPREFSRHYDDAIGWIQSQLST